MPKLRLPPRPALLAAMCAVVAPAALVGAPPAPASPAQRAIEIGAPLPVPATSTAQGFLGLAAEFPTIRNLAGTAANLDTPFVNLLRSLSPTAPLLLRLGGNSGDDSFWPTPGVRSPLYLDALTPRWAADVRALLTAVGARAIIGVNLKEPAGLDTRVARAEVAAFDRDLGAKLIDAFELGNEPEFYPGFIVGGRPTGSPFARYGAKFSRVASALGPVPLAGPDTGSPHWLTGLGTVLRAMRSRLTLVTVHAYALKNCSRLSHLTASDLLAPASIQGLANSVHAAVRAAAAAGAPLRVDETNGVSCGGQPGVSNTFAEALWALNVLPALWRAGVQGVNVQTIDGDLNQVIRVRDPASGWQVSVQPEIYGLLAFADAVPAESRLLQATSSGLPGIDEFAVRAPDRSERIVLTNVGTAARTIAIRARGETAVGSLALLQARSLSATSGVTLAGQALSPRSGQLAGSPRVASVRPDGRGSYAVRVPAHTAAILTLPG